MGVGLLKSIQTFKIELHEGDEYIIVRKQKYKDVKRGLKKWDHGDSLAETIYLEQEL